MEFCWALPVTSTPLYQELYSTYTELTRQAEKHNFDGVLFSITPNAVDPFVAATKVGLETERIGLLIAQNTNLVLPTSAARALNTLNTMIGPRVDLNIVTGSSAITLSRDTKPENHESRYARTHEFVDILQALRAGPTTYKGNFFAIENSDIYPKANGGRYFVAGSSEEAMEVAAACGDYYILYACDFQRITEQYTKVKQMAAKHGRTVRCAVLVDIIARETSEEAWEIANLLLSSASPVAKRMTKILLKSSDSVGLTRYKNLPQENNFMIDEYLWAGLSQIDPANSVAIVGSYQEAITALHRFHDAGAEYFLISSQINGSHEIEQIGEHIIPYFKQMHNNR